MRSFLGLTLESKLRHWPPATNKTPFVAPFFVGWGMIDLVSQTDLVGVRAARRRRGRVLGVLVALVALVAALGWVSYKIARAQRFQLQALRERIGAAASPGELVVVDDRVLGWALRRGEGRGLQVDLSVMDEHTAPSSLLADLANHPREVVLVARPESRLVKTLSAAGYVVVIQTGSVPWDTGGAVSRILGWGKMRILFVMHPKMAEDGAL